MFYEPHKNDHGLPYSPMKALVVPRPIGWISTLGLDGSVNLAPYSEFNYVSDDPPFVMFAASGQSRRRAQGFLHQCRGDRRVRRQHGDLGAARRG
jgi:flavin reductase (DIM6/NTAB) family NADH-FMN oxidoreductase RutF